MNDDFEFYKDLKPQLERFKSVSIPGTSSDNPFELDEVSQGVLDDIEYVEVKRCAERREKRYRTNKMRSRRIKATIVALLLVASHGLYSVINYVKPFVRDAIEYERSQVAVSTWEDYYSNIVTYPGFQRMWHGKTWKHIMPEVFENGNVEYYLDAD